MDPELNELVSTSQSSPSMSSSTQNKTNANAAESSTLVSKTNKFYKINIQ
jgi:hypothetical protein